MLMAAGGSGWRRNHQRSILPCHRDGRYRGEQNNRQKARTRRFHPGNSMRNSYQETQVKPRHRLK